MENSSHSVLEIERTLLGLILVNEKSIQKIKGLLVPEDFFDIKNRLIFNSITNLTEQGFEIETAPLIADLKKSGNLEKAGGMSYISNLISEAGLEANITKYVKSIADKAQLRKVQDVISSLNKEVVKESADAETLLEKVEQDILSATRDVKTKDFKSAAVIIGAAIKDIETRASLNGISGIPSDFPSLDAMTSGFQKGDLVILAARPSMGKTAFALNLAANAAKAKNVAIFSLEMPSEQLFKRIISFTSYVPSTKITNSNSLTSAEWTKVYLSGEKVGKLKLYTDDSPGLKLSELIWKAKKLSKNVGLDMIVIDYLQLLTVGNSASDNRQAEVALISRSLKQLARELDIPVIALSQLSRKVEQRENKTPMMSDLRESGAIEQDADIIAFMYREAYYNSENAQDEKHQSTDIIIAKHRNGATGKISLTFNPQIGLFIDVPNKATK